MKVWVVMGNDFPNAVFSSEAAADEYCARKKAEPPVHHGNFRRIYWRTYEFELQQ